MSRMVFRMIVFLLMILLNMHIVAAANPVIGTPAVKAAAQQIGLNVKTLSAGTSVSSRPELTNIRWGVQNDVVTGMKKLRLVFDATGPVQVKTMLLSIPTPRLVVDVQGAVPGKIEDSIDFDGEFLEEIRIYPVGTDKTRLVFELPVLLNTSQYKVFTLREDPANNKPHRVVVDIDKPVMPTNFNFSSGLRNKVVVIDPGHGGSDPGAIGPNRTYEKTVTLAVSQNVKALLERAGAKVYMTRVNDRDVYSANATSLEELRARCTVANNNKADVFISIHANAFSNRTLGGTSTYYYYKTQFDQLLAQHIQNGMLQAGGLEDRGIRTANFYVVKHTVMPSALVELAFISNPNEEKLLMSPQFQQKMAQGIVSGLDKFFAQAAELGGGR